ncbi:pilus (MSHA type) biogenesis protein MshL [Vibrio sp. HA2012]|uniref:pilus (MSHA type) biogenesis protein MshL n=1 Tax=Vibrio sp. HA2012 TaxID=1971595 RepID=UPI000C2CD8A3|nr:pilus (MSHA type) biogenesis protein MshL [Vibrio sp. HA2012]PJC85566.1 pilus (MSHA type) biogenesis protein MshL [Vibrio sp. HA2012]
MRKPAVRQFIVGVVATSLLGCSMGHRNPVEAKAALNEAVNQVNSRRLEALPESVQADLMPELDSRPEQATPLLKRFQVQAKDVEASTFFTGLVKNTEFSVAIHPSVSGTLTINLADVTLDEVLDVVRDMYGYDIVKNGRIIQIYPAGMRTETIPVDYLSMQRSGRSLTSITTSTISTEDNSSDDSSSSDSSSDDSSSSSSDSSTTTAGTQINTSSSSDFWTDLQTAVGTLIGTEGGRSVVTSPQAGVLTIRAYPDEIREVKAFLNASQQRLQRQVILEAKILEVTLNDSYQQGINWSNLTAAIGGTGISVSQAAASSTLPGMDTIGELLGGSTSITISDGNFSSVLDFMSTQGDLNVLSSPRVTAANNQKAVIKVGTDEYFVTDMDSETTTNSSSDVTTTSYELTPFFSGISLDVTPQIDDEGNVLLHVHPAVIEVEEQTYSFLDDAPMAKSSIRETDSIIRARDGDVVVLGGLMKSNTTEQTSKVPLLGDIPGLGYLFRNVSNVTEKTELVILLKPTVVGVHTWQQEIERSRDILQEWFPDDVK